MSDAAPRIALIHALAASLEPIEDAFRRLWPEAGRMNLMDDALSVDRRETADLTEALGRRIGALADYAVDAGADAILYTCSAFGPAIEAVAARLPTPALKPNEAMFDEALAQGARVGMVASFQPSIATMEAEFAAAAARARPGATLESLVAPEALTALQAGDVETHNRLLAEAAARLAPCDVVMLAQFSTSRAKPACEAALGREVLTPPDAAVRALRRRLGL